jgi:DNA-binding XRE family transcriptional regulator
VLSPESKELLYTNRDIVYLSEYRVNRVLVKARLNLAAIGRRIRELRGFDMTQAEFAKRIGVAQGYLSCLERGEKEPGAAVLLAISREFGKSVDWLLTGEERK